jgi:N-acyl-D-amino-acid deacylase
MRRRIVCMAAIALAAFAVAATPQEGYDILITGARLLDGSGNPWVAGSVAIKADRIARIGRFSAAAVRTIDATGL